MDVLDGSSWEVVVDDEVDAFEVNSSSQKSSADQHPDLPWTETGNNIVSLE